MPIFKKFEIKNTTKLTNDFLQNENISLAAKGLLGYMLSLPNDWKFTIEGIAKQTGETTHKIIKLLKELQNFGYHTKVHYYENGRIKEWIYYTFAEPRQDIIDGTFSLEKINNEILDCKKQQSSFQHCCSSYDKQNNNINIINDINNDFNFNKIKNETNTSNNIIKEKKLTKKQLKEKQEQKEQIKINDLIDDFTDDLYIKEMLEQYIDIRKQKGVLTSAQVHIILDDLRKVCGTNKNYMIGCIRKAIAGGWSQIVFIDNTFKGNPKTSYSSIDNTASHVLGNEKISDEDFNLMSFEAKKDYINNMDLADMTKEQREFFEQHCLARDENGNLMKF